MRIKFFFSITLLGVCQTSPGLRGVCSLYSLRVKFSIDLSFSEMTRFYWIKSLMHISTKRERLWKISWKEFWKFQVNKTNFGIVFVVKYIYICINFYIYEILLGQLTVVCTFFFVFAIKIKVLKDYQKCFLFYQKSSFCPGHFQIFVLHSFPLLSYMCHGWFYRSWLMISTKVYGINLSLNWIFKMQIL